MTPGVAALMVVSASASLEGERAARISKEGECRAMPRAVSRPIPPGETPVTRTEVFLINQLNRQNKDPIYEPVFPLI